MAVLVYILSFLSLSYYSLLQMQITAKMYIHPTPGGQPYPVLMHMYVVLNYVKCG